MKITRADAKNLTSMRCGGTIEHLIEVESPQELAALVSGLDPFLVLGGGTNTIFSDEPVTLPVLKLGQAFHRIRREGDQIHAGAAAALAALLAYSREQGLSGLEDLAGIPGTLGGAIRMNAGTGGWGIMDAISAVEIVDASGVRTLDRADIAYSYRHTDLPVGAIVTAATFRLRPAPAEVIAGRISANLARRASQPKGASSGCMFKNPPGQSAGKLIDQAGLKGRRIGGACISEQHANFIINTGGATTADIKGLMALMRQTVQAKYGLDLEEEVRIIG
jgi:UDP-N-acetylmuramate dehydrogenase